MVGMALRVRVDYEPYPEADWLEQWDTPEKYYGGEPKCPKCECVMDYEKDHTWLCDECGRDDVVTRLEWDGTDGDKGRSGVMLDGERRVPFNEYARTYGDANKYVYLYAVVESCCDHCGEWGMKDSLGGIDLYEDSREHWDTGTFTEAEVDAMREGYLRDTLKEMFEEAKVEAA